MFNYSQVPSLQVPLRIQIDGLKKAIQNWGANHTFLKAVFLIGSCSRGVAQTSSDIDLVFVIDVPKLEFGLVKKLRDELELFLDPALQKPLEIQFNFVQPTVFVSTEPAMKAALRESILFFPLMERDEYLRRMEKVSA